MSFLCVVTRTVVPIVYIVYCIPILPLNIILHYNECMMVRYWFEMLLNKYMQAFIKIRQNVCWIWKRFILFCDKFNCNYYCYLNPIHNISNKHNRIKFKFFLNALMLTEMNHHFIMTNQNHMHWTEIRTLLTFFIIYNWL